MEQMMSECFMRLTLELALVVLKGCRESSAQGYTNSLLDQLILHTESHVLDQREKLSKISESVEELGSSITRIEDFIREIKTKRSVAPTDLSDPQNQVPEIPLPVPDQQILHPVPDQQILLPVPNQQIPIHPQVLPPLELSASHLLSATAVKEGIIKMQGSVYNRFIGSCPIGLNFNYAIVYGVPAEVMLNGNDFEAIVKSSLGRKSLWIVCEEFKQYLDEGHTLRISLVWRGNLPVFTVAKV